MKSAYLDLNIALKHDMVSSNICCYVPVDSYTEKVKIMFMSFQIYDLCMLSRIYNRNYIIEIAL